MIPSALEEGLVSYANAIILLKQYRQTNIYPIYYKALGELANAYNKLNLVLGNKCQEYWLKWFDSQLDYAISQTYACFATLSTRVKTEYPELIPLFNWVMTEVQ